MKRMLFACCIAVVVGMGRNGSADPGHLNGPGPLGMIFNQEETGAAPTSAEEAPTYGDPIHFRWKVGVTIKGGNRSCKNLLITIPVPNDWPEQSVTVFEQNVPLQSREFRIRDGNSGLRQMVATIPLVRANQEIAFEYVYNVKVHSIDVPQRTDGLVIPKRIVSDMKMYLDGSPGISFRDRKMRTIVKEVTEGKETAWAQVEALFKWISENIEETSDLPTDTELCFDNRKGGPEDIVGLFVAFCRLHKVPARTVWVDGSSYAEFYLEDSQGEGHWYPAVLTGLKEFGSMSEPHIIQQKGDNLRVPEKKDLQRFVPEFVTGEGNAPKVEFIRELIPAGN